MIRMTLWSYTTLTDSAPQTTVSYTRAVRISPGDQAQVPPRERSVCLQGGSGDPDLAAYVFHIARASRSGSNQAGS